MPGLILLTASAIAAITGVATCCVAIALGRGDIINRIGWVFFVTTIAYQLTISNKKGNTASWIFKASSNSPLNSWTGRRADEIAGTRTCFDTIDTGFIAIATGIFLFILQLLLQVFTSYLK
jgi:hypothetical protein